MHFRHKETYLAHNFRVLLKWNEMDLTKKFREMTIIMTAGHLDTKDHISIQHIQKTWRWRYVTT